MSPLRPVANPLRRRVNRACSVYLNGKLVAPFFDSRQLGSQYWSDMLARAGVELVEVVRVRADTRGVFLVEHPEHGRCVLKTVFAARHPAQGFANQAIATLVTASASPIFPRVFEATPDYTVEEYVEGRKFREWLNSDFDQNAILEYFEGMKDWSTSAPGLDPNALLSPTEIREVCREYIVKCLNHARYFSSTKRIRSARRFFQEGNALADRIGWLWSAAERVGLPREMMCGDMGNVNLLVQSGTGRVFNIDYETMGPGHRGFDCAYFLSSLTKLDHPEEAVDSIKNAVLKEEYLGGADVKEFFVVFTEVLSEISRTVYGTA